MTISTTDQPKRRTADERREDVIAAAIIEFATHGLNGASTETIADRAGISQPYVLRLFGTKKALFQAAVGRVNDQIMATWKRALDEIDPALPPDQKLWAIGAYYHELVQEVNGLRLVLQSFSSAEDPDVRAAAHQCLRDMHAWVKRETGADPLAIQQWFAFGMMLTVAASIRAADLAADEEWARIFVQVPIES